MSKKVTKAFDAVQWDGNEETIKAFKQVTWQKGFHWDWIDESKKIITTAPSLEKSESHSVRSMSHIAHVQVGDWLVFENGRLTNYSKSLFESIFTILGE